MYKVGPPGGVSRMPMLAIVMFSLLLGSAITLVVLMGLQPPESSTQQGLVEFVIATQEFAPGQDIVTGVNNVTLFLPGDAINTAGSITIFPRAPNLFSPPGDTRWIRPLVISIEFRDGQGQPVRNVTLAKPAEICFKITEERWEDYTRNPNEYEVHTYSDEKDPALWEPLIMTTYPERSLLCGLTDHLSLFALATKPDTLIPLTEPTPTSDPTRSQPNDSSNNQPDGVYEP